MCRRSVGFSIDAPQKVLLVPAMMSRCGPSTKAKHGLTYIGSKGSRQKLSTLSLSHLPAFRCCCYHWTRGASARTVSQEVTENEDILKFGSLIVLSNTQEAGSSAALTMFVCTVLAHGLACVVVDSEVVQLCIPWFDMFLFSALQVSCTTSGWYSMGLVCRPPLP